jgi:hypothetical protein
MDFIVTISGDAAGPFDIYYNSISVGTLVESNVDRASLLAGYSVTIAGSPATIIVVNTDPYCGNSQVYQVIQYTPTPVPTSTPTPTPFPTTLNCTLFGMSVSVTQNATPTPTPTPTATSAAPATPTPTPTASNILNQAEVILNDISPSNVFEIFNNTVGASLDTINVPSSIVTAYGTNNAYITAGIPNEVIYRVRKISPTNTAMDAGYVMIQVNGTVYQTFNFNMNDVIDFYLTVNITSTDFVSIQIWEG